MRDLLSPDVDCHRVRTREVIEYYGFFGDSGFGVFTVPSCIDRAMLKIIASTGMGWDHVSVSRRNRPPNWAEMEQVKRLFFLPDEVAMQLHVAIADHISVHPHCLHLWRPQREAIPLPPKEFVA